MSDRKVPEAYLSHIDFGDVIELTCTGKTGSPITVVVDRDTGETTASTNDPMATSDVQTLQAILNHIGEHDLGGVVLRRYLG